MTNKEYKQIEETIWKNRPMLTASSIKVYVSSIRSIAKDIGKNLTSVDEIYDNQKIILQSLQKYKASVRKTRLSAVIVAVDRKKENTLEIEDMLKDYRKMLYEDASTIEKRETAQKITESQEDSFIPWSDIMELYNELKIQCTPLFKMKNFDSQIFTKLQQFVLLSCYVLIPPRRSKDYAMFKLRNIDKDKDNYMTIIGQKRQGYFVFNSYKNSGKLGKQTVEIPSSLKLIIQKWSDLTGSDYLISTREGTPVTQVRINQILNSLFYPKNIGSSMLRHIYLTEKYGDVDLEKLERTTHDMGNSEIARSLKYVSKKHAEKEEKKDDSKTE